MKGARIRLLALAAALAVLFVCGLVLAAEEPKKTEEPKAEGGGEQAAAAEMTPEQMQAVLQKRLKDLRVALEKATKENRGRIPKDTSALVQFLPNKQKDLINPETNNPIVMNSEMANKAEDLIENPKTFITFYADKPTPEKGRAAIFASGTIKYFTKEDEFDKALKESKTRVLSREERRDRREERMDRRAR